MGYFDFRIKGWSGPFTGECPTNMTDIKVPKNRERLDDGR